MSAVLAAGLYVVGTPIGNLEDITLRALDTLRKADRVLAEDTRMTQRLLARHGIRVPLLSCHKFNEAARTEQILGLIRGGEALALVTDSGMPGVSDPGARIVAACREAALPVTVLPGPSAVTAAIALCGFESAGFRFAGFLPHKPGARRRMLEGIAESPEPVAFFESPFRFLRLLAEMREILPDRRIFVARELTKLFEECRTGTPDEVEAAYAGRAIKGELVIVVAPAARPPREGGREAEAAERPEGRTRNDADEHG